MSYKIGSQFPKFTGKTFEELVAFVNELIFKIQQELLALQKTAGGDITLIRNIGGVSGGGTTTSNNVRITTQTVASAGNVTVNFSPVFPDTNYNVKITFWDSSGFERQDAYADRTTKSTGGFTVNCPTSGTLETISVRQ